MNKIFLLGVVAVVAVFGLGYLIMMDRNQVVEAPEIDIVPPPEVKIDLFLIKLGEQNESEESGTATISEMDGKVKILVNLTGAPTDLVQPAHIHAGACPDLAEIKYPLSFPINGISETVLDVTLDELRAELPLGINVHKSNAEMGISVACGDMTL